MMTKKLGKRTSQNCSSDEINVTWFKMHLLHTMQNEAVDTAT